MLHSTRAASAHAFPLNWLKRQRASAHAQLVSAGALKRSIADAHQPVLGSALPPAHLCSRVCSAVNLRALLALQPARHAVRSSWRLQRDRQPATSVGQALEAETL